MALTTPIVRDISPFDATIGTVVSFDYNSNVKYAINIKICTAEDGSIVYEEQSEYGYLKKYTIPENTLENGVRYSFEMQIVAEDDTERSLFSRPVIFLCTATPVFEFFGMPANNKIETSYVFAKINYVSENPNGYIEPLNILTINLYKAGVNTLIKSSGKIYNTNTWEYEFSNLENGSQYRLEATGETVNGMTIKTETKFYCEFAAPTIISTLSAKNNWIDAAITVASNIIIIEPEYDGEIKYVDGTAIDLTDGNELTYNQGFYLGEDFTIQMIASSINVGKKLLQTNNGDMMLYLLEEKSYYNQKRAWYKEKPWLADGAEYTTEEAWFNNNKPSCYLHLIAENYAYKYEIDSNKIDMNNVDNVLIVLRRKNGLYSIEITESNIVLLEEYEVKE